jgi:hypothetical protein
MATDHPAFHLKDRKELWEKYCGFLDFSLTDFTEVQEHLLIEQIDLVQKSSLANKIMPIKPNNISEFREHVPLTIYDNYAEDLNSKNEDVLAVKPKAWAHTSGRGGSHKWVPYTDRMIEMFGLVGAATMILACSSKRGEINIGPGMKILTNLPSAPYMTGLLTEFLAPQLGALLIPPPDQYADAEFATKIQAGFAIALRSGVDILCSMASVLIKMGERFTESSGQIKLTRRMLHPQILRRLLLAWIRSKRANRPMLPKDLWPLKGLACFGMDTSIYREQLIYLWGKEPYESYGATETGLIATHAWNKKYLIPVPWFGLLEFIPEKEWIKSKENKRYQPSTILLNEVEPGERYEIVVTNFHGMPFLRYRLGDIIRVVALEDEETGIKLPQMIFESRADDLIDIAGFTRLDEKTIWQAIANVGVKFEEWTARKEYEEDKPVLKLYIELKEDMEIEHLEHSVHTKLLEIDSGYKDLEGMLGRKPLRVTILPEGSFQRFYEEKRKIGVTIAQLKPPHMNASDNIMETLLTQ